MENAFGLLRYRMAMGWMVGAMLMMAGLTSAQEQGSPADAAKPPPLRNDLILWHSTRLGPAASILLDIAAHTKNEHLRAKATQAMETVNEILDLEVAHQQAVMDAIVAGDAKRVGELASEPFGVNFRSSGKHWTTPLHSAVGLGDVTVVATLLEHAADTLAVDYRGERPMYDATEKELVEIVRALLDYGVPVDGFAREITWGGGGLPLAIACRTGNMELVELLLARGANVNADGGVDWPPLLVAVGRRRLDITEKLLDLGANANQQRAGGGYTPLHAVAGYTDEPEVTRRLLNLLLEHGAKVDMVDARGRTPLHQSACWTNLATAGRLIEAGAPLDLPDHFGITAYGYADALGQTEMVALLRQRGATASPAFLPEERLHRAIFQGDEATVQKLLAEGADANGRSASGWTPLHVAAFCPRALPPAITDALLAHGADLNAAGPKGWTPAHILAICDDSRMIRDLLKAGADPRIADSEGNLPSTLARNAGNLRAERVFDGRLPLY